MNRKILSKMVWKKAKLRPVAERIQGDGRRLEAIDDEWMASSVEGGVVDLANPRSQQHVFLDCKAIIEHQGNPRQSCGFFKLKVQVLLLTPSGYRIEPLDMRQILLQRRYGRGVKS